ncbi:TPA: DUF6395 domain-containing protein [Aeromonas veronii]|uniref:DUF6395 domain-containing protein n=1 Tax=Aeromonas veronii TaxID=654 RepID=UPI003CF77C96
MIAKLVDWGDSFTFQFTQEENDFLLDSNHIILAQNTATFKIANCCSETHPDLIALSAILLVYPFIKSEIKVPFGVSQQFATLFNKVTKKNITPVDKNLAPRTIEENGIPSLCYSAGVDSTAALMLMPGNTKLFFCDRVMHENTRSMYNKFAAINTVLDLKRCGYDMNIVATDFEYIRSKVGFPTDLATAVPALMCADQFNIDSVAFGIPIEVGYRLGHSAFENYKDRLHYKRWGALFSAVGCQLYLPTVGVSEVGNFIIASNFKDSNTVRSCMRGDQASPCGKCLKCFRKTLISAAIANGEINEAEIISNLNSSEVIRTIASRNIKLENVYRYILKKADAPILKPLLDYIEDPEEDILWMEKWYSPSICFIPEKYRGEHIEKVLKYLDITSDEDNKYIESWVKYSVKNNSSRFNDWVVHYISMLDDEKLINMLHRSLNSDVAM